MKNGKVKQGGWKSAENVLSDVKVTLAFMGKIKRESGGVRKVSYEQ